MDPKYQASHSADYMSTYLDVNLFKTIIDQGKPLGLEAIKLTGGEPLLHPQIEEILRMISETHNRLIIETNGVLCTQSIAKLISQVSNQVFVSVSLDGCDSETHDWVRGVPGSFVSALEGIENLVKAGVKPQIVMALMRKNRDQIESVVQLAEEIGVSSVKFNPIQPIARGDLFHNNMETLSIHELVTIGAWVEKSLATRTNLVLLYTQPMAFKPLSRMFGGNSSGCGVCGILNILGVLSDGSYSLCGIGESVQDLVFGHAAENNLEEVWRNTPILEELREGFPEKLTGVCKDCLMKAICKGSCIAQNYYNSGGLWSPFWYCEQAHNSGLFPLHRLKSTSNSVNITSVPS